MISLSFQCHKNFQYDFQCNNFIVIKACLQVCYLHCPYTSSFPIRHFYKIASYFDLQPHVQAIITEPFHTALIIHTVCISRTIWTLHISPDIDISYMIQYPNIILSRWIWISISQFKFQDWHVHWPICYFYFRTFSLGLISKGFTLNLYKKIIQFIFSFQKVFTVSHWQNSLRCEPWSEEKCST